MLNANQVTNAFVDEAPVNVTPNTTARDVMRAQGLSSNRSLVQMSNSGKPVNLKPNDRINLANGNRFDSIVEPEEGS
jgi:hypothetical protein